MDSIVSEKNHYSSHLRPVKNILWVIANVQEQALSHQHRKKSYVDFFSEYRNSAQCTHLSVIN